MNHLLIRHVEVNVPLKEGLCFYMGKNEEDFWKVIHIDHRQKKLLMMATRSFGQMPYHSVMNETGYEGSEIRDWLNRVLYEGYFTEEEKEAIVLTKISDPAPAGYSSDGIACEDRIFLLSADEAEAYSLPVKMAVKQEACWLRTAGRRNDYPAFAEAGYLMKIDRRGSRADQPMAVYPCFNLDLESGFLKQRLSTDEKGNPMIRVTSLIVTGDQVTLVNPSLKEIEVPEGVRSLGAFSFYDLPVLESVILPSTLREVESHGLHCMNLKAVLCASKEVSFHSSNFMGLNHWCDVRDLLTSTGQLPPKLENFVEREPELLAHLWCYQRGASWYNALLNRIDENNVHEVLREMIRLLGQKPLHFEKAAEGAADFVKTFWTRLSKVEIEPLISILKENHCLELAEDLENYHGPAVYLKLQDRDPEWIREEDLLVDQDGTIKALLPLYKGCVFRGWSDPFVSSEMDEKNAEIRNDWKVMEIDGRNKTVLAICEQANIPVEYIGSLFEEQWANSTARAHLNESMIGQLFSKDRRDALVRSNVRTQVYIRNKKKNHALSIDRLYLLSEEEVRRYYPEDGSAAAVNGRYILRDTNVKAGQYHWVDAKGKINHKNQPPLYSLHMRPVCRMDLECDSLFVSEEGKGTFVKEDLFRIKDGVLTYLSPAVEEIVLPECVKKVANGALYRLSYFKKMDYRAAGVYFEEQSVRWCMGKPGFPQRLLDGDQVLPDRILDYLFWDPACWVRAEIKGAYLMNINLMEAEVLYGRDVILKNISDLVHRQKLDAWLLSGIMAIYEDDMEKIRYRRKEEVREFLKKITEEQDPVLAGALIEYLREHDPDFDPEDEYQI